MPLSKEQQKAKEWVNRMFSFFLTFSGFRLLVAGWSLESTWTAAIGYFQPKPTASQSYAEQCIVPTSTLRNQFVFNIYVFLVSTAGLWLIQIMIQHLWEYYTKHHNTYKSIESEINKVKKSKGLATGDDSDSGSSSSGDEMV
jgi:hypothetical protein